MLKFNPEMLTLAREARGYSQEELAGLMRVSQGTLSKIENGNLDPQEYLENLSDTLDFPIGFFMRDGRQFKTNAYFYRKKIRIPRKEISKAEALMNIIKFNVEKLLKSVEVPAEKLPKWEVSKNGSPSEYAKYLREYWRIPKGRVDNLTKIVEDNGIIVIHVDFGSSDLDGLSLYTDDNQAIVFLNKNMSGDRIRLTLAHEVGHLGMHFAQVVDLERDVEKEAYEFASELLVPSNEILPHLSSVNLGKLADLKRYWKVSMSSLLVKAKRLNLIKENSYRYLWTQFRKNGYHIQEPPELNVPIEKPTLIKEILDAFINDLDYTKSDLAILLNLNLPDFENFFYETRSRLKVIRLR
ncbi:MAG TPA: XRE family transcriptional regulator [Saprospiraceae bacterium]|nr:XRE family transcriptional regulator [Saprospiraceae bacterium]HMP23258.1 XRE family transcriptional regulator [Saprospiraceae bacterium]